MIIKVKKNLAFCENFMMTETFTVMEPQSNAIYSRHLRGRRTFNEQTHKNTKTYLIEEQNN